jgi:hypothetical protein
MLQVTCVHYIPSSIGSVGLGLGEAGTILGDRAKVKHLLQMS